MTKENLAKKPQRMNKQKLDKLAKEIEASHKHVSDVEDLTIGQLMVMANDGLVNDDLLDNLYYHLLDSKKVRNYFK